MAGIIQKIGEKLHGNKSNEEVKHKPGEGDHKHQEGQHKEGLAGKLKDTLPHGQQHDGEKKKKKDKKDKKKHEDGHKHGGDSSSSDSD
ncbi:dehydrin HIRD11-like [Aristolochia californica]|uniref:dehydrin HIRD11-like n=1 Tax=Aristolochia californica TaxID=171875 RepID=UPI0035D5B95D